MRICPSLASFVTQAISPSASKRGVNAIPSSNSLLPVWLAPGPGDGEGKDVISNFPCRVTPPKQQLTRPRILALIPARTWRSLAAAQHCQEPDLLGGIVP